MKKKIFVALSSFAQHGQAPVELLKKSGFEFVLNTSGKRLGVKEIVAMAVDADGIIAGVEPYDTSVLEQLPRLRCLSRCGVGTDNIDLKKAEEKGVVVLNTSDVVVQPVAELTLAMAMDLLRKITFHTELLRQNKWQKLTGNLLKGKTVGIIGLGRIGKKVAELFLKLDAHVCATDLNPDQRWAKENNVRLLSLEELLRSSDIVTLHLFTTDDSFCLGIKELGLIKKGAVLINTARGKFIDETALVKALKNGHLAGAAVDVYPQEPYAGELCRLPNVLLTPHVATLTEESRLEMEIQATNNLIDFLKGNRCLGSRF